MNNLLRKSCKQLDSEPRGKQARVCITTFISTSLGKSLFFCKVSIINFFLKFHIHKILYFNTQKSNMREGAEILKKKKVKTDTAKYLMNNYRRRQNKYYAFSRVTGLPRDIKANKVVA